MYYSQRWEPVWRTCESNKSKNKRSTWRYGELKKTCTMYIQSPFKYTMGSAIIFHFSRRGTLRGRIWQILYRGSIGIVTSRVYTLGLSNHISKTFTGSFFSLMYNFVLHVISLRKLITYYISCHWKSF